MKSWLRVNVTGLFCALSVFGRRIKWMIRLRPEQVWTCNVTLHVHTCSGRNRIFPLMRRPNTDSAPNKPVTLPRNQLLIRYVVISPRPHCHDTVLRYAVILQVCIHPKITNTHPLRLCNTYCFYTTTMVARTQLIVALYVHCLSC
jgi:hypothetical protein